jgi:hypothetical protein
MIKFDKTLGLICIILFAYFVAVGNCIAWMSFLIIGLVLLFKPPQFITGSGNSVFNELQQPGYPDDPTQVKFYGNKNSVAECQAACAADPNCMSYAYDASDPSPSDIWALGCYGKLTPEIIPPYIAAGNFVYGLKVDALTS